MIRNSTSSESPVFEEKRDDSMACHNRDFNSTFTQPSKASSRADATMVLDNMSNTFTIENESTWCPFSSTFNMVCSTPYPNPVGMETSLGLLSLDQLKDFSCTVNNTYGDDLQNIPEEDTLELMDETPTKPKKYIHDRMSSTPLGIQAASRIFHSSPLNTSEAYTVTEPALNLTSELKSNANLVIEQIKARTCLIKGHDERCDESMDGFAPLDDATMLLDQSLTLLDISMDDSVLVNAQVPASSEVRMESSSKKYPNAYTSKEVAFEEDVFSPSTEIPNSSESKTISGFHTLNASSTLSSANSSSATSLTNANKTIDLPKIVCKPKILQKTSFKVSKLSVPNVTSRYATGSKMAAKQTDAVRRFSFLKKNKASGTRGVPYVPQPKNTRTKPVSKGNNAETAKNVKVHPLSTVPVRKTAMPVKSSTATTKSTVVSGFREASATVTRATSLRSTLSPRYGSKGAFSKSPETLSPSPRGACSKIPDHLTTKPRLADSQSTDKLSPRSNARSAYSKITDRLSPRSIFAGSKSPETLSPRSRSKDAVSKIPDHVPPRSRALAACSSNPDALPTTSNSRFKSGNALPAPVGSTIFRKKATVATRGRTQHFGTRSTLSSRLPAPTISVPDRQKTAIAGASSTASNLRPPVYRPLSKPEMSGQGDTTHVNSAIASSAAVTIRRPRPITKPATVTAAATSKLAVPTTTTSRFIRKK